MLQRISYHSARKNAVVYLSKDLPVAQGFGNRGTIKKDSKGYISSNGFENGQLKVEFYSHYNGTEHVEFNVLSAENYLLTDIY